MDKLIEEMNGLVTRLDAESNKLRAEGCTGDARAMRQAAGLVSAARWVVKGLAEGTSGYFAKAARLAAWWATELEEDNKRAK